MAEGAGFAVDYEATRDRLKEKLGVGTSFDLIHNEWRLGDRRVSAFAVNGFFQDLTLLDTLREVLREPLPADGPLEAVLHRRVPYIQVAAVPDEETWITNVLSGPLGLLIEGVPQGVVIDTRAYPGRNPSEPATEKVLRGPRDGFVENILYNTALTRRRLRDPRLRNEIIRKGQRSRTDIALTYIEGLTDPKLVAVFREKLEHLGDVAGLPMAEHAVAEALVGGGWNPYPVVRYTERPDVVVENLLEGRVVIFVDTSPIAIVAPTTFFNHIHHPEDYHLSPAVGTYMRLVVLVAIVLSIFLPPVWLYFAQHAASTPPGLRWLLPTGQMKPAYSVFVQVLLAEIGVDLIRRAVVNTPSELVTAISVLGAVLLGELAAKVNLFSGSVLIYMAVAAVGQFATSSLELGMANRLTRLFLVLTTGFFGIPGLLGGTALWLLFLLRQKSFGIPYLWPLVPFHWPSLVSVLVREPMQRNRVRPPILFPYRGGGAR